MIQQSELRRVPMFADLPDDQLDWFLNQSEEIRLKDGDVYAKQGDPAEGMFVMLEGQFHARGDFGGELVPIPIETPGVTGALPFSRMTHYPITGRALSAGRVLKFPAAKFSELVQRMPVLTQRLVGAMSDRIRAATRTEQQRDRLAALGKLSAGLAHELNNPASAAKRATSHLRDLLKRIKSASHELGAHDLTPVQKSQIENVEASLVQKTGPPPDPLTVSTREEQIDELLRRHGQNDLWQLAADLARKNANPELVENLFTSLGGDTARAALVRIAASLEVGSLLDEIESSVTRISELVAAIKEYTFMDQGPVQNLDVVRSLENTLTILNHKLKRGVSVVREYHPVPLLVNSFGSELNQVWTNIMDNAIDAMNGKGELRIRTFPDDSCVVVEIGDNGPGIPRDVQPHIFEPFFTTKAVGQGTGLGLDTVQRIVRKHRGTIQVTSQPGDTRFQVWLPLADKAK